MAISALPSVTDAFHPAVATWFARRFPQGPSEPQRLGWPEIGKGVDTLIAAPTGSGKTLSGFLVAIDALYRAHAAGEDTSGTRVVYVSPLKALAVDIHENLLGPLAEIEEVAAELGLSAPSITVAVRTGDTTAGARAAMLTARPTFVVTTPESLYLLVTAARSRAMLSSVETVIVDEIHAMTRDKRGSHLSLSLERLDRIVAQRRPQRVGLSATQRPISMTAAFLSGVGDDRTTSIVDCGHGRELQLSIELPDSELSAVWSTEQLGEVLDRIAAHVLDHRTTIVFVNTRRLSERLAHELGERLGGDQVAAHHGSLSKERRQRTESRLRAGDLQALVATASLELGIDIGPVELVCQVGSPRSIATLLQRVGRSNHSRGGVPEGVLFPMTRDELVECAALLWAVREGKLDRTCMPIAPLDILAQQLIAEVAAAEEWKEDELFELVRRAAPYETLRREDFDEVVALCSEGIATGNGRRMAYLHRDSVNAVVRPRRGARLAALTSGGAIPEVGDYRVVADPDETPVGSVNEDFAIESMVGDVFLLGTHSWRIRRVEPGTVRVVDAEGAQPTIPFWVGEAPSRTAELSSQVALLRGTLDSLLRGYDAAAGAEGEAAVGARAAGEAAAAAARQFLEESCGLEPAASTQVVAYLDAGRRALGLLPTTEDIVFERFFDEAGGMQLVVHSPGGGRVNKAFGLALRKRFCATFDFELQAAANDDALVLSLGPQHSFPLESAPKMLRAHSAAEVLTQAVLASPMFASRWRWNLNRSLAILRFRGGRKNPLPIQRMEADDLLAAVFPALAACQENAAAGPIQVPDHVIVRQTVSDCLHEAMDVDGLVKLLEQLDSGEVRAHFVDSPEPSVLAHEILNGKPYTFLDDAPLEERRTRAVALRRGLPLAERDLAHLDAAALARVRDEAAPALRDREELHDLLVGVVLSRPREATVEWFEELVSSGRALRVRPAGGERGGGAGRIGSAGRTGSREVPGGVEMWCAIERRRFVEALVPGAVFDPVRPLPQTVGVGSAVEGVEGIKIAGGDGDVIEPVDPDVAAAETVRGHLDINGPVTVGQLAEMTSLAPSRVRVGLGRLEAEGFALRGRFDPPGSGAGSESAGSGDGGQEEQWCARRLLARIHGYTQARLRREIEPVTAQDFMRFVLRWQHVAPGTQRQGRAGVLAVVDQLQGFEIAAGAWEENVLSARVENYQRQWLEDLCLSGSLAWGRLGLRAAEAQPGSGRGATTPSRATPITFANREDLDWLLQAARGNVRPTEPGHGAARDLLDALRDRGALFRAELGRLTGRLPVEIDEGLWDLVTRGLVTADGFQAVRSLLSARETWRRRHRQEIRTRIAARRPPSVREGGEGRWALLPAAPGALVRVGGVEAGADAGKTNDATAGEPLLPDDLAELVAWQLLNRWGVVFWDLMARETTTIPWREIIWALRRFEARGLVRGGRFVSGFVGEQFALPEAVDELRSLRRTPRHEELVKVNATDPLNLVGIVLPGPRVAAVRTNTVTYRDGLAVASGVSPELDPVLPSVSPGAPA